MIHISTNTSIVFKYVIHVHHTQWLTSMTSTYTVRTTSKCTTTSWLWYHRNHRLPFWLKRLSTSTSPTSTHTFIKIPPHSTLYWTNNGFNRLHKSLSRLLPASVAVNSTHTTSNSSFHISATSIGYKIRNPIDTGACVTNKPRGHMGIFIKNEESTTRVFVCVSTVSEFLDLG